MYALSGLQKVCFAVFIGCLIAMGGITLYQKGIIRRYAPSVDRLIQRTLAKSPFESDFLKPGPISGKPERKPDRPKAEKPRQSDPVDGLSDWMDRTFSGDQADVIYSWEDETGARHFTNTSPPSSAKNVKRLKP